MIRPRKFLGIFIILWAAIFFIGGLDMEIKVIDLNLSGVLSEAQVTGFSGGGKYKCSILNYMVDNKVYTIRSFYCGELSPAKDSTRMVLYDPQNPSFAIEKESPFFNIGLIFCLIGTASLLSLFKFRKYFLHDNDVPSR